VVGIGASAGGLEALEQFFSAVPPRCGMAFVVIQHLDPTHPSAMASLLKRHTAMPVAEAEERPLEPDNVYVMPPTKIVSLEGRTLRLRERAEDLGLSVDVFFQSLASELKESAVGIILSGTGRDGALGAKAIKSELGMVMVQDPPSARYDGMPRAAISAGVADFILAPHEMPARLIEYMSQSRGYPDSVQRDTAEKESGDLQRIFSIIRLRTRRDFTGYKLTTLKRRIERRLTVNRIENLGEYAQLLSDNGGEADALFKDLLINVTSFFRDEIAFALLKECLLARLAGKKDGDTVRAWAVGCSTGEEAYSLAILLLECVEQLGRYMDVQVFGTDIDSDAVAAARAGIYPASIVQDLSEDRLRKYFVRKDNQFQIKKDVREKLVFAVQDVTADPPFSKMDLVSVRNVLIYLGAELQRRVIPVLHYALDGEGILFLGTAENIGEYASYFTVRDRKWKIYQRKGTSDLRIPLPPHTTWRDVGIPPVPGSPDAAPLFSSERALLQSLGPSVLVDSSFHIVYVHGETSRFLELGQGEPTMSIMEMAREELKSDLSAALLESHTEKKPVIREGIAIVRDGAEYTVRMAVQPVFGLSDRQGYAVVSFFESLLVAELPARGGKKSDTARFRHLEEELQFTRENLRSTIEQLETANEELRSSNEEYQSTNEELQSTNEELETSREELQSVNEELLTVNNEYQSKIEELSVINDDMMNLLNSSNTATIFLDSALQIKRYTPAATRIFNLIGTDVGRPLGHLTSNLRVERLTENAQKVLDTLIPFREEVQAQDGRWYSMRLHPYRTTRDAIAGVVLSFIDINEYVVAQTAIMDRLRGAADSVARLASLSGQPMLLLEPSLRITMTNAAFRGLAGIDGPELEGSRIFDAQGGAWNSPDLHSLLEAEPPRQSIVTGRRVPVDLPGRGHLDLTVNAYSLAGVDGLPLCRLLVFAEGSPAG
jgi:two-component system CheB/CheR fusion protein